ncbi:MAG: molybdenum cofactor biosynthesis protein MoaE [Deltaproteobacteria bacterium]|nr:molybdenum cofactor biosynthesis protein MoaE [Deltaproteobacteria bacterium]
MNLLRMIDTIKKHPHYHRAGMILCHNGIVRGTSRSGRKVSGLTISVDYNNLRHVIETYKQKPGIIEILVEIADNRHLTVGDDIMFLVVAGDIRENVISVLNNTLNAIKTSVTSKTEYFMPI